MLQNTPDWIHGLTWSCQNSVCLLCFLPFPSSHLPSMSASFSGQLSNIWWPGLITEGTIPLLAWEGALQRRFIRRKKRAEQAKTAPVSLWGSQEKIPWYPWNRVLWVPLVGGSWWTSLRTISEYGTRIFHTSERKEPAFLSWWAIIILETWFGPGSGDVIVVRTVVLPTKDGGM